MTTTTSLLDELRGLLDSMPDDADTAPPAATPPSAPATLACAAPQPATTGEVVVLADARAKAEARKVAREAMVDAAMHAAIDALQVIRNTFRENGADFDDACKALPLVHKVLEHLDRMEAGAKDAKSLPPLHFNIILDGTPQVPPPNKRARTLELVEVVDPDA